MAIQKKVCSFAGTSEKCSHLQATISNNILHLDEKFNLLLDTLALFHIIIKSFLKILIFIVKLFNSLKDDYSKNN